MAGTPTPIVLLHGFTQTSAGWDPVVDALRPLLDDGTTIEAPDLPGHGTAARDRADLPGAAAALAAGIDDPALVVGYSMGGRLALRLALDHPDRVAALVLVGATAGIDDPHERAARRTADAALADRIEAIGTLAFLDEWVAQPLFAGLELTPADRAAREANDPAGLASSLRLAGTGTMDPPWWDELARIDVPVVVAWGERDAKFAALGARLVVAIGQNAAGAAVPDAGHAAHLEQPAFVAELVVELAARVRDLRG